MESQGIVLQPPFLQGKYWYIFLNHILFQGTYWYILQKEHSFQESTGIFFKPHVFQEAMIVFVGEYCIRWVFLFERSDDDSEAKSGIFFP